MTNTSGVYNASTANSCSNSPSRKKSKINKIPSNMPPKAAKKKGGQTERVFRSVIDIYTTLHNEFNNVLQAYIDQIDPAVDQPNPDPEKAVEEKHKWYRATLEIYVNAPDVHIYVGPQGHDAAAVRPSVLRRLLPNFLLYNNDICFNTHRLFDNGISSNFVVWLNERNSMRDGVARRMPFAHTKLEQYLQCSLSEEDIYNCAKVRFQTRNLRPGTWAFHLGPSARGLVTSIPIHVINHVAYTLSALHTAGTDPSVDESESPFFNVLLEVTI